MKRIKDFGSLIWELLDGHKTHLGALIIFVAGGLSALGKIDEQTTKAIIAFGGAVSLYGLRDAIKKVE